MSTRACIPEVVPEQLGRMPIEAAINKARYDFGTIAIKASADSSLPPYLATKLAEIRTLAEGGEALLEAVLRAHHNAEEWHASEVPGHPEMGALAVRVHFLDAQGDTGAEP